MDNGAGGGHMSTAGKAEEKDQVRQRPAWGGGVGARASEHYFYTRTGAYTLLHVSICTQGPHASTCEFEVNGEVRLEDGGAVYPFSLKQFNISAFNNNRNDRQLKVKGCKINVGDPRTLSVSPDFGDVCMITNAKVFRSRFRSVTCTKCNCMET